MTMFTSVQIRKIRLALGLSLAEFADRLGVTEAAASRWETGNRHPRFGTLVKLNELADQATRKAGKPIAV